MKLGDILGNELEDDFVNFDLTEIQKVLQELNSSSAIDLPHAEKMQQLCLRGADLISDYLCKITKTLGYLESKTNRVRNQAAVEFKPTSDKSEKPERVTADVRKAAAEASPEVEALSIKIATAKAAKSLLDKKYDIISKSFYYYKEIAAGYNRTSAGFAKSPITDHDNGWS